MSETQPEARTPALPLADRAEAYGWVTRVLHWSIAALILWQFICMTIRLIFGRQDFVGFFVGTHAPVGTLLLVLIVLRLVWAWLNRNQRPAHGAGLLGLAAKSGHLALYGLMLVVPSLAFLRGWGGERPFKPFGLVINSGRAEPIGWTESLGNFHGALAWVFGAVILGHILMVVVHEKLWRDGTLAKMAGRAPRR